MYRNVEKIETNNMTIEKTNMNMYLCIYIYIYIHAY